LEKLARFEKFDSLRQKGRGQTRRGNYGKIVGKGLAGTT